MAATEPIERIEILGVPVCVVNMPEAVEKVLTWGRCHESHYVCACDVHSVMQAYRDDRHRMALCDAAMIVPDGQPLVWTARMRGKKRIARVCGPDLFAAVCEASQRYGLRHYFYGGADGVAALAVQKLRQTYPDLAVAGFESPPFRPLTAAEETELSSRISDSRADIMWIGLGCPKQERWMREHVQRIPGVVLIGVGAAFDFQSKKIRRAPVWMQNIGLEWLHRLSSEPRRLWRRYLILAPQFVFASLIETARLRLSRGRLELSSSTRSKQDLKTRTAEFRE